MSLPETVLVRKCKEIVGCSGLQFENRPNIRLYDSLLCGDSTKVIVLRPLDGNELFCHVTQHIEHRYIHVFHSLQCHEAASPDYLLIEFFCS